MANALFGKNPDSQKKDDFADIRNENIAVSNLTRRMRILEERIYSLQKKFSVTEKNMIDSNKSNLTETKLLDEEVSDIKTTLIDIKEKMSKVIEELENKADADEFLVFKKYLEIWRPINFVTKTDVDNMIKSALKK
jgi:hypothetical protein